MTGAVDIESLGQAHWLLANAMDVQPMRDEFGWEATPLAVALAQYMAHLRNSGTH